MAKIQANGIEIDYDLSGDPNHPVIVLIRGLSTQWIHWPGELLDSLRARGFRVLIFDNRDVGRSQKFDSGRPVDLDEVIAAAESGRTPVVPYTLFDMAADTVGLIDALHLPPVHLAGISMGGRIAQIVAARYPDRVKTLCSIMSSTGKTSVGAPTPEAIDVLLSSPRDGSREAVVEHVLKVEKHWEGSQYPHPQEHRRWLAGRAYDRGYNPQGVTRQIAATIATGDQSALATKITAPTLVIHGTDDILIPPVSGEDTAQTIPGARYVSIEGMGHDIPPALSLILARHITSFAEEHS